MKLIAKFIIFSLLFSSIQIQCARVGEPTSGTKSWPRIIAGTVSIFTGVLASVYVAAQYRDLKDVRAVDTIIPVSLFGGGYSLIKRGWNYHEDKKSYVKDFVGFIPIVGAVTLTAAHTVNKTHQGFDCREEG